jgi:hypothetical protein
VLAKVSFKHFKVFLTCKKLNAIIVHTLKKHIGAEARAYSCRSFRAALPSALAAKPMVGNKENIKRWGRWNSDVYERYTRLSHRMKRRLFDQFVAAILMICNFLSQCTDFCVNKNTTRRISVALFRVHIHWMLYIC